MNSYRGTSSLMVLKLIVFSIFLFSSSIFFSSFTNERSIQSNDEFIKLNGDSNLVFSEWQKNPFSNHENELVIVESEETNKDPDEFDFLYFSSSLLFVNFFEINGWFYNKNSPHLSLKQDLFILYHSWKFHLV